MQKSTPVLVWLLLLLSCSTKKEIITAAVKPAFTSFELSYYSGFERRFDIRIDSNKIYFNPSSWNVVRYGIIPDSLFNSINTTITEIINNKSLVNKEVTCEDCPVIASRLFYNNDSIRIRQDGKEIDEVFLKMTRPLYKFLDKELNAVKYRTMYLETRVMVRNPLPYQE